MSPPKLLFLDFDGTLTVDSTLPIIASISTYPELHPQLKELSSSWMAESAAHSALSSTSRKTLEDELRFLASIRYVEAKSLQRVKDVGIYLGVTPTDVERVAKAAVQEGRILLRKGWTDIIAYVLRRAGVVHVISVAWSARFIGTVLKTAAVYENLDLGGDGLRIISNEIDGTDGSIKGNSYDILTSRDKAEAVGRCLALYSEVQTVFVGDSLGDLEALVSVDIGIVIRGEGEGEEQKELATVCERMGIEIREIGMYGVSVMPDDDSSPDKRLLWRARDFEEVLRSGILE